MHSRKTSLYKEAYTPIIDILKPQLKRLNLPLISIMSNCAYMTLYSNDILKIT